MAARVSVLMSIYNPNWEYLKETLDSIENQSFTDYELVVVNDGADEKRLSELLSEYSFETHMIKNPINLGLPRSLNEGLKVCTGEYIARIDDDDIMMPQRLQTQCDYMDRFPDVLSLFSNYIVIDENGESVKEGSRKLNNRLNKHLLYKGNCLCHSSLFTRKKILNELSGYDGKMTYAQDYDLHLRMMKVGKLHIISDPLVKYRVDNERIPKNKRILSILFAYYASLKNMDGYRFFQFWSRTIVSIKQLIMTIR